MKLIFHGWLKERFGDSFEIKTKVPADAIEGFFSQHKIEGPRPLIEAVGFPTEGDLRSETDKTEVHLIPSMYGGGGKFGSIILGAVMIGLAFTPLGAVTIGLTALKSSLIVAGAMMALQGVVGLFLKAPTISKSEDPPASKYLGINTNTVKQGTSITVALGKTQLRGHWLSLQSDADKLSFGSFPENPT